MVGPKSSGRLLVVVYVSLVLIVLFNILSFLCCPWVVIGNTKWGFWNCCNESKHENCSTSVFDEMKGYIRAVYILKFLAFCASSFSAMCDPLENGRRRYIFPLLAATAGVLLVSAMVIFAVNYQSDSTFLQYGTPTLAYAFWLQVAAILSSCLTVFTWWIYDLSNRDVPSTFLSLLVGLCKTVWRIWKRKREKTRHSPVIGLSFKARSTDCPAETTSPDVKDLSHLQNYDITPSNYGLVMFPQRLYQHRSSPPPPYDVAVVGVNVSPPSYRSLWSSSPSIHHNTTSTVV